MSRIRHIRCLAVVLAGLAGSQLAGSPCRFGGGSVIFGSLSVGLSRLCRVGTCPVRTPWHPIGARLLKGPLHTKLALLLALVRCNYIRKDSVTSRDGRIEPAT